MATVVTGDFNQARIQDYTTVEWDVVAAGLSKVQQPQVDGVSMHCKRLALSVHMTKQLHFQTLVGALPRLSHIGQELQ